jgi:glutamine cyclotransferase
MRARKIVQIDPQTGAILRTQPLRHRRYLVDGELLHRTWESDASEVRRVDPQSGEVLEAIAMPAGISVSGLESDGGDRLFCGGGSCGKVRVVRHPKRSPARG